MFCILYILLTKTEIISDGLTNNKSKHINYFFNVEGKKLLHSLGGTAVDTTLLLVRQWILC